MKNVVNNAPVSASEEVKSPASWKEKMRKALAADLEEALAEDMTSPKSLIPGNNIKANGYNRFSENTPRSVDSIDSQTNERGIVFGTNSRHSDDKADTAKRSAKVPTLWRHGETPRAENIASFPSNSHSNTEEQLMNPAATAGWVSINPESTQYSHPQKSAPDPSSILWSAGSTNSDAKVASKPKASDVISVGLRSDLAQHSAADPAATTGSSLSRIIPAETSHTCENGGRANTISPLEVSAPDRGDSIMSNSSWAPVLNPRQPADPTPAPPVTGGNSQDGTTTALRHSASSSFVPIRSSGGGGLVSAPAPRFPASIATETPARRGADAERRARALSDPARGSYLEEFAAATASLKAVSSDLKVAHATVDVQKQLIQKFEARYPLPGPAGPFLILLCSVADSSTQFFLWHAGVYACAFCGKGLPGHKYAQQTRTHKKTSRDLPARGKALFLKPLHRAAFRRPWKLSLWNCTRAHACMHARTHTYTLARTHAPTHPLLRCFNICQICPPPFIRIHGLYGALTHTHARTEEERRGIHDLYGALHLHPRPLWRPAFASTTSMAPCICIHGLYGALTHEQRGAEEGGILPPFICMHDLYGALTHALTQTYAEIRCTCVRTYKCARWRARTHGTHQEQRT